MTAVQPRTVIPKAEQARRTRKLIVATGIRCLATHGFASTTMLLIAREAGISRGPLHYHFADRNALMAAIAEALPRGVSSALLERLSQPRTITERLETRKVVERAKGLLMTEHGLSEPEAFRWVQRNAMDRRTTMRAVAQGVVDNLG